MSFVCVCVCGISCLQIYFLFTCTHLTMTTLNFIVHTRICLFFFFRAPISLRTESTIPHILRAPFHVLRPSSNVTTYMFWCQFLFAADSNEETFSSYIKINKREISQQRCVIFFSSFESTICHKKPLLLSSHGLNKIDFYLCCVPQMGRCTAYWGRMSDIISD